MAHGIIPHLESPLARHLVTTVLSTYFVVAITLTAIQLYSEFKQEKSWLEQDINSTVGIFKSVLAEAIWTFDDSQIEKSAQAMQTQSTILGIIIVDHNGEELSGAGTPFNNLAEAADNSQTKNSTFSKNYRYGFPILREVDGKQVLMGEVLVLSSSNIVVDRALATFYVAIISSLIKIFFLWLIIVLVLNKNVSLPLQAITSKVKKLNPYEENEDGDLGKQEKKTNELKQLSSSFSEMSEALHKKNKELLEYQSDLEEKVASRTKKLEKAAEEKSLFLANMSHEIRTPMNGMLGILDLLKGTKLTEMQEKYLGIIDRSGNSLLSIINDILDYSKLESKKLELESIPFNLFDLVDDCVSLASIKAAEKDIAVNFIHDDSAPQFISGDPTRLGQVLNNFLSNAIKFTEKGKVEVSITTLPSSNTQNAQLQFSVKDTGIGLSEEQISKLFHSFTQADSSTTRKYGGTGLGLTICKRIVELMGGEITVTSKPNLGSCFAFTINAPVVSDEAGVQSGNNAVKLSVNKFLNTLLINCDDNFVETIDVYAEKNKGRFQTVNSLNDGINAVGHGLSTGEPFNCVWLCADNNFQKAEIIANSLQSKFEDKCPPVFVNVANGFLPAPDSIDSTTITTVFEEEICSASLETAIKSLLINTKLSEQSEPTIFHTLSNLKVLIAEDNPINKTVIMGMMKKLHINAKIVSNGALALHEVKQAEDAFDLIFMDCEMPILDGWEATEKIRQFEKTMAAEKPTKIIGLSAHALSEHGQRSLDAGMDNHLTKPVNIDMLYSVINPLATEKANNILDNGATLARHSG